MSGLTQTPAWQALEAHAAEAGNFNIVDLVKNEPGRAQRLILDEGGKIFDFSRHLVNAKTMTLLFALARQQGVSDYFARMLAGEKINETQDRAVLHTVLRAPDAPAEVVAALAQMKQIADTVRADKKITDVIHIGIGGSDLGPRMVCHALRPYARKGPKVHFVANVDPDDLDLLLETLKAENTLVIAVSKTFTTTETLMNLRVARDWLKNDGRIIAVTANTDAAQALGINPARILPFWDWVGGRFSVWSAVALPIAIACGYDVFEQFLKGAHAADRHAAAAPAEKNIPLIMALLMAWYRNFIGCASMAVLPYSEDLALFPSYLQQLEMESNGKRVDRAGQLCAYATAPVIFGGAGTNIQHAFMQMIHQGTDIIPCDFIGFEKPNAANDQRGTVLLANMHAQSEALMRGGGTNAHNTTPGNRPSTIITLPGTMAEPGSLGFLMAIEEHKTAMLGFLWHINPFDQFGVELGKVMAKELLARK